MSGDDPSSSLWWVAGGGWAGRPIYDTAILSIANICGILCCSYIGLHEKKISYDFKFYVGTIVRGYETHPQNFPFSRSLHRDTTMVISGSS